MRRGCWCWLRKPNCAWPETDGLIVLVFVHHQYVSFYLFAKNSKQFVSLSLLSATKYVNFFMRANICMTGSLTVTWETPSERSHTFPIIKLSLLAITFLFFASLWFLVQHLKSVGPIVYTGDISLQSCLNMTLKKHLVDTESVYKCTNPQLTCQFKKFVDFLEYL